jgi:hypothetical protein
LEGDGAARSGSASRRIGLAVVLALPSFASAGEGEDALIFVAGGGLGLVAHEAGHLVADLAFGVPPQVRGVDFGGIPFFAVSHPGGLPPRQEFTIASAGFWAQHASSEWLLSRRPELRARHAPLAKGVLAFNVLASTAYAGAAFARAGPVERDTRAMAESLGVAEPWVGAMVLAPAALDAYRYYRPRARWAGHASRVLKIGMVLLVLVADG